MKVIRQITNLKKIKKVLSKYNIIHKIKMLWSNIIKYKSKQTWKVNKN